MPAAARLTDMHTCPMSDGPKPHVGGPITGPGVANVLIASLPASVVGDMATCAGPPDVLVKGSATVMIGGRPAVRMGDTTAHGGVIILGCPTVLIGDAAGAPAGTPMSVLGSALAAAQAAISPTSAQAASLLEAAEEGVATVEHCPLANGGSP